MPNNVLSHSRSPHTHTHTCTQPYTDCDRHSNITALDPGHRGTRSPWSHTTLPDVEWCISPNVRPRTSRQIGKNRRV